jgi:hypothetical protein
MAITVGTPVYWDRPFSIGGKKVGKVTVTFDSSYAAGGYAFTYANIAGLDATLDGLLLLATNSPDYQAYLDNSANKIVVWDENSEAASSASLGSISATFLFIGY